MHVETLDKSIDEQRETLMDSGSDSESFATIKVVAPLDSYGTMYTSLHRR